VTGRAALGSLLVAAAAACAGRAVAPARLDTAHDACAYCRMIVSDRRFASQIVAPLEEPRFFDDLGCLANYLREAGDQPPRTAVYVADHSSGKWVLAGHAVFTEVRTLTAPMGSHVVAHESAEARAGDPAARSGRPTTLGDVLPGRLPGAPR
jgi:copper chaperone NosL